MPSRQSAVRPSFDVGARWIYTTPSGKGAHYRIVAAGVTSRNGTEGCIELHPEPADKLLGYRDVTCLPKDLRNYFWSPTDA